MADNNNNNNINNNNNNNNLLNNNNKKQLDQINLQQLEKLKIPIYSPRTSYKKIRENDEFLLQELMLKLDPFTVSVIANDFDQAGGEVDVANFIILMREHLKDWQPNLTNRDYKLMRTLVQLFEQIDLNQNKLLDWEELANYVLGKATVIDNIKLKNQVVKYYSKNKDYYLKEKFQNVLQKILYIDQLDKLVFFQKGSDLITIIGTDTQSLYQQNDKEGLLHQKQLKIKPKDISINMLNVKREKEGNVVIEKKEARIERNTIIIDILFISDYNLLMVSSNDRYIRAYRYVSNGFIQATFPKSYDIIELEIKKTEASCLSWDSVKQRLYCGLDNGNIIIWELGQQMEEYKNLTELQKKEKSKSEQEEENKLKYSKFEHLLNQETHKLVVQDIVPMAKLQYFASAGLDGVIILWDTITNKKKREYREHNRGILTLAFNQQNILLFSAGFDHWIGVFNPYTDHIIYKIKDHSCPIYQIQVLQEQQQLISLDQEGNVKIRDLNKFSLNQHFSLESHEDKHKFEGQDFCYSSKPLKLYFIGNNIQQYQYDINYNPGLTDDNIVLTCEIVSSQLTIYTPAGNKVKVWSMLTGELLKIFTGLTHQNSDITSFILDNLKKRMLIGDAQGYIQIFNAENGAKIKSLPKHDSDVTHIYECHKLKLFITASINNQIHITLDNDFGENELLRVITLKEQQVSSISFYNENKLLLVSTSQGQVAYFESDSGQLFGISQNNNSNEFENISYIEMIQDLPFLLSTTSNGKINIIACPPLLYKFSIVESFQNFNSEDNQETQGIVFAIMCQKTERLFISDEQYYIKCFDLKNIIANIKSNIGDFFKMDRLEKNQFLSQLKNFTPLLQEDQNIEPIWSIKAHNEQINSLNFSLQEQLIVTSSTDKKVKLWNSLNGQYIAFLQQSFDNDKPTLLAYRKKFTQEIYDPSQGLFERRIDVGYQEQQQQELNNKSNYSQDNKDLAQKRKSQVKRSSVFQKSSNFDQKSIFLTQNVKQESINEEMGSKLVLQQNSSKKDQSMYLDQNLNNKSQLSQFNQNQEQQPNDISIQQNSKTISKVLSDNLNKSKLNQMSQSINDEDLEIQEDFENKDSKIITQVKLTENQIEDLPIQAEYDPYYYLEYIDFEKIPDCTQISNNEWKLFLDFQNIVEENEQHLQDILEETIKIEKENEMIQFKEKKFNIVNFEVNPKLFDPNNNFKPYINVPQEKEASDNYIIGGSTKEEIANKVKKQQIKEQGINLMNAIEEERKKRKVNEETWENLYKNKKNTRNLDPKKFKQQIMHSRKISDLTKLKVQNLLEKLECYDQDSNNINKKFQNQNNQFESVSNSNINQQSISQMINDAFQDPYTQNLVNKQKIVKKESENF